MNISDVLGLSRIIIPSYRFEFIEDKAKIANAVSTLLNHDGGVVFCSKKDGTLLNNKDAIVARNGIYNYLKKNISNFPVQNVKVSVEGTKNDSKVVIRVKKSDFVHVPKTSFPVFISHRDDDKVYNVVFRSNDRKKSIDELSQKHDIINSIFEKYFQSIEESKETIVIEQKEGIRSVEKHLEGYYKVGDFAGGNRFYKYMSLENVLQCFENNNIWFVEPAKWQDKFENYFYSAKINGELCSSNNPLLYATCVTNRRDSESAWKIYSYNTQGLASRCVELVINRLKFREQLLNAKVKESDSKRYKKLTDYYDIYEGEVEYKDEQEIINLTKPKIRINQEEIDNKAFNSFFNPFTFESYLNLMLMKRNAFRHESEVRIFIVPKKWKDNTKNHSHLDIKLNWNEFLEGVRYDCHCSKMEKDLLLDRVRRVLRIKKKDALPEGFKFEPYDVYQGPEPPTINSTLSKIVVDISKDQLKQLERRIPEEFGKKLEEYYRELDTKLNKDTALIQHKSIETKEHRGAMVEKMTKV